MIGDMGGRLRAAMGAQGRGGSIGDLLAALQLQQGGQRGGQQGVQSNNANNSNNNVGKIAYNLSPPGSNAGVDSNPFAFPTPGAGSVFSGNNVFGSQAVDATPARERLGRPDYGAGNTGSGGYSDDDSGSMDNSANYNVTSGIRNDLGRYGTAMGGWQQQHPVWSRVIGSAIGAVVPGGNTLWSRGDDAMRAVGINQPSQPGSGNGSMLMNDPTFGTGTSLRRPVYAPVPSAVNQGGWGNTYGRDSADFWNQYQPSLGLQQGNGLFGGMYRTSNGDYGLNGRSERAIYGGSAGPSWDHTGPYAF